MTAEKKSQPDASPKKEVKLKTCFIIMPIADHPDYEPDHFKRVYEYLIKPACIAAGYEPYRADDSKASHMIMFDILKKIMDCDMAICDLSSKNANVFYELGLRQAFNKKTILITDGREKPPFDIAGFRYVQYTSTLRVDSVNSEIISISKMLHETENAPEDDVNSIVKLLQIQPAKVDSIDLNKEESLIYGMLLNLQKEISGLKSDNHRDKSYWSNLLFSPPGKDNTRSSLYKLSKKEFSGLTFSQIQKIFPNLLHDLDFIYNDEDIGKLTRINDNGAFFNFNGDSIQFPIDEEILDNIIVK